MDKYLKIIITALGSMALLIIVALLLALPVMWAWNYVMPYLFGLKTLGWLQAWCLMFVSGCLFKSTNVNTQ